MRVGSCRDLRHLLLHGLEAPLVGTEEHEVVDGWRWKVCSTWWMMASRGAKKPTGSSTVAGPEMNRRTLSENPGNPLTLIEELGFGAGAHNHLVAGGDEELEELGTSSMWPSSRRRSRRARTRGGPRSATTMPVS